ncbi:hypothetical protein NEOKW01_1796 [Nematocida sp. AWRm80]|nr:hypothetical protein NEOKW01_1796 [Nematocida sp. AWRm80]
MGIGQTLLRVNEENLSKILRETKKIKMNTLAIKEEEYLHTQTSLSHTIVPMSNNDHLNINNTTDNIANTTELHDSTDTQDKRGIDEDNFAIVDIKPLSLPNFKQMVERWLSSQQINEYLILDSKAILDEKMSFIIKEMIKQWASVIDIFTEEDFEELYKALIVYQKNRKTNDSKEIKNNLNAINTELNKIKKQISNSITKSIQALDLIYDLCMKYPEYLLKTDYIMSMVTGSSHMNKNILMCRLNQIIDSQLAMLSLQDRERIKEDIWNLKDQQDLISIYRNPEIGPFYNMLDYIECLFTDKQLSIDIVNYSKQKHFNTAPNILKELVSIINAYDQIRLIEFSMNVLDHKVYNVLYYSVLSCFINLFNSRKDIYSDINWLKHKIDAQYDTLLENLVVKDSDIEDFLQKNPTLGNQNIASSKEKYVYSTSSSTLMFHPKDLSNKAENILGFLPNIDQKTSSDLKPLLVSRYISNFMHITSQIKEITANARLNMPIIQKIQEQIYLLLSEPSAIVQALVFRDKKKQVHRDFSIDYNLTPYLYIIVLITICFLLLLYIINPTDILNILYI